MEPKLKKIIAAQLKKAEEKLKAARTLFKEGFISDAISRAYYSIYHSASAVLASRGLTPPQAIVL